MSTPTFYINLSPEGFHIPNSLSRHPDAVKFLLTDHNHGTLSTPSPENTVHANVERLLSAAVNNLEKWGPTHIDDFLEAVSLAVGVEVGTARCLIDLMIESRYDYRNYSETRADNALTLAAEKLEEHMKALLAKRVELGVELDKYKRWRASKRRGDDTVSEAKMPESYAYKIDHKMSTLTGFIRRIESNPEGDHEFEAEMLGFRKNAIRPALDRLRTIYVNTDMTEVTDERMDTGNLEQDLIRDIRDIISILNVAKSYVHTRRQEHGCGEPQAQAGNTRGNLEQLLETVKGMKFNIPKQASALVRT
ncbi:hypothetical protein F4779DRAFT_618674 [Xylariaceae sp. FL0662B]|nr:hypothetical protein F4779DRAFT_618674 [Xylariaceae sp. FL0662B]